MNDTVRHVREIFWPLLILTAINFLLIEDSPLNFFLLGMLAISGAVKLGTRRDR